jgi:hypothetical protein
MQRRGVGTEALTPDRTNHRLRARPDELWAGGKVLTAGVPENPELRGGMKSLLMSQLDRGDGYKGIYRKCVVIK